MDKQVLKNKKQPYQRYGPIRFTTNWMLRSLAFLAPGGGTLRPLLHKMCGVNIGKNVWISLYVLIDSEHAGTVTIMDNSVIGIRTSIIAHMDDFIGPVVIEEGVFVGPHCMILPNVRVGKNSVISAGSIVTQNVPPNTLWAPQRSGPTARVTVPLIRDPTTTPYKNFLAGLRPLSKKKPNQPKK